MSALHVAITPAANITLPPSFTGISAEAVYTREIASPAGAAPRTVQDTLRIRLDKTLHAEFDLPDAASKTPVSLRVLGANGGVLLTKTQAAPAEGPLNISLTAADAKVITATDPQPAPNPTVIDRRAYFVPAGTARVPFE